VRYRVSGANQVTGGEISLTVDAEDEAAAEAVARAKGILVADVVPERIPSLPDADLASAVAAARQRAGKMVVPMYEGAKRAPTRYGEITRGAMVLRVLAILAYVAGGACVLFAFYLATQIGGRPSMAGIPSSAIDWVPVVMLMLTGLFYIAIGALLSMLGAVGLAIRDMANNSFRV